MTPRCPQWIHRLPLVFLLLPLGALARVGGGEHYTGGSPSGDSGGDGGMLVELLMWLVFRHPAIGIPLALIVLVAWILYTRSQGDGSTRRAIQRQEAEVRTTVSANATQGWVDALKAKDPAFELIGLLDKVRRLFLEVQQAWFLRELEPVRRFMSDATFQRLLTQQRLLALQGVRDAVSEVRLSDLQIIGLEPGQHFDTVHVRIKASARDTDVPADTSDDEALRRAALRQSEPFVEVWSLVRKPGTATKPADALAQGNCPNCGAPFSGGASNRCEFCKAIVNSGNYDWTLAEITQGVEFRPATGAVPGLEGLRRRDPDLSLQVLEDRGSLIFWRWLDEQARGEAQRLLPLSTQDFVDALGAELGGKPSQRQYREVAVGSVETVALREEGDRDLAHLEVRWSARAGTGSGTPVLNRWVLVLQRKRSATTNASNGMSTHRCPNCGGPLEDSAATACAFCGTVLTGGERDWVLREILTWEAFRSGAPRPAPQPSAPAGSRAIDREERERLLYMMAALAAADGLVDEKERALLKMCAERWGLPWANVELALNAGPGLYERLVTKKSPEAEQFLAQLVELALVDGKVDRRERQMLTSAALHLGVSDKLPALLKR